MARISMYVDVDLDEISTSDLIEELETRPLRLDQQKELAALLRDDDKIQFDLFLQVKDRYSIYELEQLFGEKPQVIAVSKEQLRLEI
jgi:hypothetical protein